MSRRRIASGTGFFRILWRHILPNTLPPLLVQGTFIAASAMITEAILSFHRRRHAAQHPELGQHHGRGAQPLPGRLLHRPVPRASSCRSRCWRSTCSATGCATRSTRAWRGACSAWPRPPTSPPSPTAPAVAASSRSSRSPICGPGSSPATASCARSTACRFTSCPARRWRSSAKAAAARASPRCRSCG